MALAGLISALIVSPFWIVSPLIGPLWGLALIIYFFACERVRDPFGLLLFLFVSAGAFEAAVKIASGLGYAGPSYGVGAAYVELPSLPFLFTAGSAGALMVLVAGVFAFGRAALQWTTVASALLGSAGGGLLALVAGFAGQKMPDEARSGPIDFGISLVFLLWQPGVAAILGLTLNADRKSAPSPAPAPDRGNSRARRTAVGIAAGLCLLYVGVRAAYYEFQGRQIQSQTVSAYQQYVAATPPSTDVSVDASPHPEQLFLPGEISGLVFCPASVKTTPQIFRQRAHGFLYQAHYDNAHNKIQMTPCDSWVATVEIRDVPNPAWSQFEAKYPIDGRYDSSDLFQPAVKFSQNVFVDQRECTSWPSGHLAIKFCYESGPLNEDLLEHFLQKYPSVL
jgi:hypothetical protein